MRKILSLVLVLTLVLGSFSFAFAAQDDVSGHENEAAIRRLMELGLVEGDSRGIRPDDTITRAEFATMVVRVLGKEDIAKFTTGATNFADVPAGHWASGYINVASTIGLVNGYGDGNFGPEDEITYEQALTIVVRALGYNQEAVEKGGYPVGYLVVADDLDLDIKAEGTAGVPTTRATVFQMLDNALTVDMMVQDGFGEDKTYKVEEGKTLLGELGYDKLTARVVDINTSDLEITLEDEGDFEVPEGFEFEKAYGLELTVWVDGDEVVVCEINDEPMFDAVTGAEDEITLVSADEDYAVVEDATLILDGEEVKAENFNADYAKVVLNDEDEVIWAQGFTFDDTFVVEEVEDGIIYSYNSDELDSEDYVIVKDGTEIVAEDIEEGDILFYNKDEGYIVVYNESENGEITRVYDNAVKFEGEVYDYALTNYDMKYLDGTTLGKADKNVLDAMMDEDENVTVYFDFAGDIVLVEGDQGESDTTSFYAVVESTTSPYPDRGTTKYTFDILNEEGDVVKYDLTETFADEYDGDGTNGVTTWTTDIVTGAVVEVTVDEDGDITEVALVGSSTTLSGEDLEIDATYAEGYRLQDDAVVFWDEDNDDAVADWTVMTWLEAEDEFSKVLDGGAEIYPGSNGRVAVMVVTDTDVDSDTTDYTGLVTNVRELNTGDTWEVTIEVNGEEYEYLTDGTLKASGITGISDMDDLEDKVVTVTVGNESEEISAAVIETGTTPALVTDIDTADDEITVSGSVYELVENAVIYDATDNYAELSLRDLEVNDKVSVYFVNNDTTRFVEYVIRTDLAPTTGGGNDTTVIETNYVIDSTSTFKVDLADGLTESDYIIVFAEKDGTVAATISTFTDATSISVPSGLTTNTEYTIKVMKVSDGTVEASVDVLYQ
ncbi:S-layer homology domain-containing protein [Caldisalinibacter kiritimatiensis]|uniref:S-layer protein n=1 Tax=Caldisalinibacter kiritimatiensis TaxID=1304284 RepID=R1CHK2_9FIRM|nr:S-layer homology domain-containing protein [Caldisalinibacter kiritimatiensis]EOD01775.1 S-layer protein [Caldisalinibacter kiritimatiensis]